MPRQPSADDYRNNEWNLPTTSDGNLTWQAVEIALLNDIRRELRKLNQVFACWRFQAVPTTLEKIEKNTRKKRKRK